MPQKFFWVKKTTRNPLSYCSASAMYLPSKCQPFPGAGPPQLRCVAQPSLEYARCRRYPESHEKSWSRTRPLRLPGRTDPAIAASSECAASLPGQTADVLSWPLVRGMCARIQAKVFMFHAVIDRNLHAPSRADCGRVLKFIPKSLDGRSNVGYKFASLTQKVASTGAALKPLLKLEAS